MRGYRIFAFIISAAVIIALGAGISLMRPPFEVRKAKLDTTTLVHLQALHLSVQSYYTSHHQLPERIEMTDAAVRDLKDMTTGKPYEYHVKNTTSYELCAEFNLPTSEDEPVYFVSCHSNWHHAAGRQCFVFVPGTSCN